MKTSSLIGGIMGSSGQWSFCPDPLWDLNTTWYTENPDFTKCFQNTVLSYLPCAFLVLILCFRIRGWTALTQISPVSWTHLILWVIPRPLITIALSLLSLSQMVIRLQAYFLADVTGSDVMASAVTSLGYVLVLFLHYCDHVRGARSLRTSGAFFGFWVLSTLSVSIFTASAYRFPERWQDINSTWWTACLVFNLLSLCLEFWHPKQTGRQVFTDDQMGRVSPEVNASFPSRLFFNWFDTILWDGWKKPLTAKDLYDLDLPDRCRLLSEKWNDVVASEMESSHMKSNTKPNEIRRNNLIPVLIKIFGFQLVEASFIRFINVTLQLMVPNILSFLINFASNQEEVWKGYFYVTLLISSFLAKSLTLCQYYYKAAKIGLRMKAALGAAVFKKAINLAPHARKDRTVGETVTILSVDVQSIANLNVNINTIWSSPYMIGFSLYFLWNYLGPSSLAGLAMMTITIPVDAWLTSKIKKINALNLKFKDSRIKTMNEILEGIRVIKYQNWEDRFQDKVNYIRSQEIDNLKKQAVYGCFLSIIFNALPFLVAVATFAVYVLSDPQNNVLTADKAFVSLSYFNLMRQPLNGFPNLMVSLVQASVSIGRIKSFLGSDEINPNEISHLHSKEHAVTLSNASFTWDPKETIPHLRSININIKKGSFVAVVGDVGSGKSSLLSALAGEMSKLTGEANIDSSVAYLPQLPWLQNASIRDNILFGREYEEGLYTQVVKACDLTSDLECLPAGDGTEIGEKGINLSGGQKQRISLARALYSVNELYLLDDPLASVDVNVGNHLFNNVIGSNGILKDRARLLVTNNLSILAKADTVVFMKSGSIHGIGTFAQLMDSNEEFAQFSTLLKRKVNRSNSEPSSDKSIQSSTIAQGARIKNAAFPAPKTDPGGSLMKEESMSIGSIGWSVYFYYIAALGIKTSMAAFALQAVQQGLSVSTNIILSIWSDDPEVASLPQLQNKYLAIYASLGSTASIIVGLGSAVMTFGGLKAAQHLHRNMLRTVLKAPIPTFFDINPKGRILNRFSKDQNTIDSTLPFMFTSLIRLTFSLVGTAVALTYSFPAFLVVILPLTVLYICLQIFYLRTARQLRRLQSVALSPVYSHFSESLSGSGVIRAFGQSDAFMLQNHLKLDYSNICSLPNLAAERWLSLRLEMLGMIILLFVSVLSIIGRGTINPGIVGLSLTYASSVTQTLNFLIRQTSQLATNMISVERVKEYQDDIEQEAPYVIPDCDPPSEEEWPKYGAIKFDHLSVRYREGLDLTLKDLSFSIQSREKVAIVGRTGAGKSSIIASIFRILEPVSGAIYIDEVNINQIGLTCLRSNLSIIPQDPILFSGTLRFNIDPTDSFSDYEIWSALEQVNLTPFVQKLQEGLNFTIYEGGSNLSVGQKQLVCLARAFLRKTRILIMDEATAYLDLNTDLAIQSMIRIAFADCTVITIAHRLQTILDYNRVLVLDQGEVVEFDTPANLVQDRNSSFFKDVKKAGLL